METTNNGTQIMVYREEGKSRIPCACKFCHASKLLLLSIVEVHFKWDGRDPWIRRSVMGDDPIIGWPEVGKYVVNSDGEESDNEFNVEGKDQHD
jgi:hypothetical protein